VRLNRHEIPTHLNVEDKAFAGLTMRQLMTVAVGPTTKHVSVDRYYQPQELAELAKAGRRLGFRHVEAGPLVRSSYHGERQLEPLAP